MITTTLMIQTERVKGKQMISMQLPNEKARIARHPDDNGIAELIRKKRFQVAFFAWFN